MSAEAAMLPRIDAHQHFWRYAAADYPWIDADMPALRRDWLPQDLRPLLDAQGIDLCIAVQARADEAENAFLLGLAQAHPWIAAVVGWVDLFADDAGDRVAQCREQPRFKGVRHLLQDDPDLAATLADARFGCGVGAVQSQELVYELLVRGPAQLALVPGFCARHDRHWLVLDHLGKPAIGGEGEAEWRRHLRTLAAQPHVACKLSGLVTEVVGPQLDADALHRHLDAALDAFGAERLMFGSDWPVCLLRADYAAVATLVRDWALRLSEAEHAQLWGGTAMRCYGLQP
jgi:L-fuconolactonase